VDALCNYYRVGFLIYPIFSSRITGPRSKPVLACSNGYFPQNVRSITSFKMRVRHFVLSCASLALSSQ